MKEFPHGIATWISLTLAVFIIFSFIIPSIQMSSAREYINMVVTEIETSDFSTAVITDIQSRNPNYAVSVKNVGIYEEYKSYEVKVSYPINIPILGVEQHDTITAYAR